MFEYEIATARRADLIREADAYRLAVEAKKAHRVFSKPEPRRVGERAPGSLQPRRVSRAGDHVDRHVMRSAPISSADEQGLCAMLGGVETRSVSPVFVGRADELSILTDALTRAASTRSRRHC